jgi:hypothetical protein
VAHTNGSSPQSTKIIVDQRPEQDVKLLRWWSRKDHHGVHLMKSPKTFSKPFLWKGRHAGPIDGSRGATELL